MSGLRRSALSLQYVVQCFDSNYHVKKAPSRHTATDFTDDILKLDEQYQKLDFFSIIPGRLHDSSCQMSKTPLYLLTWMKYVTGYHLLLQIVNGNNLTDE